MSKRQSLRHPGDGESGGAERGWQAQQGTQSFSPGRGGVSHPRLGLVDSLQPSGGHRSASGSRESGSSAFGLLFPGSFIKPGLFHFAFVFPCGLFLSLRVSAVNSSLRKPWYFRSGALVVSGTCEWNPVPWTPRGERLEVLGGVWVGGGQGGGTMPIGQPFRNGAGFLASQAGLPSTAQLHRALLARVQHEWALRGGAAQQLPPSLHPLSLSAFLFLSGWTKHRFP